MFIFPFARYFSTFVLLTLMAWMSATAFARIAAIPRLFLGRSRMCVEVRIHLNALCAAPFVIHLYSCQPEWARETVFDKFARTKAIFPDDFISAKI